MSKFLSLDGLTYYDEKIKDYVDAAVESVTIDESNLVHKSGTETISGAKTFSTPVTVNASGANTFGATDFTGAVTVQAPSANMNPATKQYVDNELADKADLVGGIVPSSQLPAYVDDVLEYAAQANFPATGESGKIYVAQDTNRTYRWSGTAYVEISASLALGETSSTAYRGDRGKIAYDHSQSAHAPSTMAYETSTSNIKVAGTVAVGTSNNVPRADHVHPAQTTVTGNAGTATKLATARTITLSGDVTGSTSFDGSGNVTLSATVSAITMAEIDALFA